MKGKKDTGNEKDVASRPSNIRDAFEGEFLCTICEKEGNQSEATNFCMECNANLCPQCVGQHRKFPTMRAHKVLGKSARKHLERDVEEEENLLECQNHPGKMVDMYCSEHDEVWCGGCMAVYHKTCSNVIFITEAAKTILKSKAYKDNKANVTKMIKEYAQLKQRVEKNMDNIAKQSDTVSGTIRDLRTRVNALLDDLEVVAVGRLKEIYSRNLVQIGEDKLRCEAVIKALSQVDRELNKPLSPTNTEPDIFVYLHRAKEKLRMATNYHGMLNTGTLGQRVRFVIEPKIEEWLHEMRDRQLGHFIYKYRLNEVTVKLDDDVQTCVINGASVVTDERLLMTDWANKRLKLLDKFFSVVDTIDLETGPNDVCHVSTNEAMVSLPDEKSLQLVKIDPKLALGKKYDVGVECRGMEYWAGELYVICGGLEHEAQGHLRVYNTTGKLIRAIEHDHIRDSIFSIPMRMAISNDGSRIFVTDGEKGIITLKKSGEVLPPLQDPAIKWPWGICADNNDQLFVCGSSSNNVVQLRENRKLGVALQAEDGLKDPMAICFFPYGSRLIVTQDKSDFIKVFTPL
ncbi:hypothetical protein MAR_027950 [Mya arenaria]|uniref:B box-type domain-containing protein n=1 Tax=Mya arenaria TaxID=6604 RepID=A0ABY7DFY9_MYAAR|nr:uncharacterized protein LOC128224668 [Mya arenaria]WAQ95260.1 hypothetical protein MAR_027950 [Mya arenaria]